MAGQDVGTEAQRESGKQLYLKYCAQCHGDNGDGKGYATPHLLPQPRDFTTGKFKVRSSEGIEIGKRMMAEMISTSSPVGKSRGPPCGGNDNSGICACTRGGGGLPQRSEAALGRIDASSLS